MDIFTALVEVIIFFQEPKGSFQVRLKDGQNGPINDEMIIDQSNRSRDRLCSRQLALGRLLTSFLADVKERGGSGAETMANQLVKKATCRPHTSRVGCRTLMGC